MPNQDEIKQLKKKVDDLETEIKSIRRTLDTWEGTPIQETSKPVESNYDASVSLKTEPSVFTGIRENVESWLGSNLIGKAGFLAIILAFIWFLTYAFENYWINESGRIYVSLIVGYLLWGGSYYYTKQKYEKLPVAMLGTGISILFLGIFSAYRFYSLISIEEVFLAMVLLSASSIGLAWMARSQVLYIFGSIGAFLNPVLLSTGENSYKFLFSYLIILNLVHLLISSKFYWRFSAIFFPIFNLVLYHGWASSSLSKSSFLAPFAFLFIAYTALFLREIYLQSKLTDKVHWSAYFALLIGVFSYSFEIYSLLKFYYAEFAPIFLLVFSIIPLIVFIKSSQFISTKKLEAFIPIVSIVSLFVLVLAFQTYAKGEWLYLSYVAAAGSLSLFAASIKHERLFFFASLVWLIALFYLFFRLSDTETIGVFLFNTRFLVYALSSIVLFASFYVQREKPLPLFSKLYYIAAVAILVFGTFMEVYHYTYDRYYRNLGYSYTLAIYAGIFLIPGFIKYSSELRKVGMILISLLIVKFYIYDIWTMSLIVKIIAAFSLGIGLVVTGMFYEKFKSKLFGGKNMFPLFLLLSLGSLSFFTEDLSARPFRDSGYKYYKTIDLDMNNKSDQAVGRFVLDQEILSNSNYDDIRIVQGKTLVPYVLRSVQESNYIEPASVEPKVIGQEKISEDTVKFIIKLPDLPKGAVYSSIIVSANETFEANMMVTPLMTQNGEGEASNGNVSYYDASNDSEERREVKFSTPGRYKFARVELTGTKANWMFPKAKYVPFYSTKITSVPVDLSNIKEVDDDDVYEKVYYIPNEKKVPFRKIQLDFEDDFFDRRVTIYEYSDSDKEYNFVTEGKVVKHKDKEVIQLSLDLNREIRNKWKLQIHYGDNSPLKLKSLNVLAPEQEIVFLVNSTQPDQVFKVYYGNPYVTSPYFDQSISYNLDTGKDKTISLKLGAQESNPNFSYDIMEPPVSSWIIRIVFFLGLAVFAGLGVRIYSRYGKDLQESIS